MKPMIRRVQVYGQRCSGTNALIKLIETNFPELTFTEEFGFKHWLVPEWVTIPDDVMIVIIVRRPDQWLRSLHDNPWHAHPNLKALPFSAFIQEPWESVWDDDFWDMTPANNLYQTPIVEERCPTTGKPFANAIAKRTAKLRNWIAVAERASAHAFVSHDDLVSNPAHVLSEIAQAANVHSRREWILLSTYKGAGEKPFELKSYDPLTDDDQRHVDTYLDPDVERRFAAGKIL